MPPSRRRTLEASHAVFILRENVRQNLDRDVAIELGVGGTALGFEQNKIRIPDIPNRPALLAELMAFEAVPFQNGMTRFSAPPGGHDDLVMALMIVNLAVSQPRIGYQPGSLIA